MFGNIFKKKDYFDRLEKISVYNYMNFTQEEQLDAAAIEYAKFVIGVVHKEKMINKQIKLKRPEMFYEIIEEEKDKEIHDESNITYIQGIFVNYHIMKELIKDMRELTYLFARVPLAIYDSIYDLQDPNVVREILHDILNRCTRPDVVEYFDTRYDITSYQVSDFPEYSEVYSEVVNFKSIAEKWPFAKREYERFKELKANTYKYEDYYNENGWMIDKEGYPIGKDLLTLHPLYTNSIDFKGLDKLPFTPMTQALIGGDFDKVTKEITNELKPYLK